MREVTAKKLVEIKRSINSILHDFSLSKNDKDSSIDSILRYEYKIKQEVCINALIKIHTDKHAFADEYNRLVNNELIDDAIKAGKNHFKSLVPCSNKIKNGSSCGNTVRYISNRGCTICQSSSCLSKTDKEKLAKDIIGNHDTKKNQAQLVQLLMSSLNIKKSAAYRLITLNKQGVDLYNKNSAATSYEIDEGLSSASILKESLQTSFNDPFRAKQRLVPLDEEVVDGDRQVEYDNSIPYEDMSQETYCSDEWAAA